MNVSITRGPNKAQSLPYTAADLMRMTKASQPVAREKHPMDKIAADRYHTVSASPVLTYAPSGRTAARQKNHVGTQVDLRA